MRTVHLDDARLLTVVFSDGLGDRIRTTDSTGHAVEVLRLNPGLLEIPSFEIALRERAARVSGFRDPAFVPFLRIDRVGARPHSLAIVSERVMGRRLSAVLAEVEATRTMLPSDLAMAWLRQIVAAVARLHAHGLEHGALAPERLIVNESGGIVIGEHVLGEAIEALQWPRQQLWRNLRVAMPPTAGLSRVDQQADLVQIGTIALALMVGRRLRDDEYPTGLRALLREASECAARAQPSLAPGFAGWLVGVLQHEHRAFGSARQALAALDALSARPPSPVATREGTDRVAGFRAVPVTQPTPAVRTLPVTPSCAPVEESGVRTRGVRRARWALARRVALVLLATGFTASLGASHYRSPADTRKDAPEDPPSPAPSAPGPERSTVPLPPAPVAPLEADLLLPPGWIEISAPVDMTFLEGGATIAEGRAGRLAAKSGVHDIEVFNQTLGLRETRRITVRPGGVTRLVVQLPFGVVDLNAKPWAEVWLDGQHVGETPIGNLSVPIGPHEFVFRHPEFGERRLAVSLTTGVPTRLSVDMTRQ